MQIVYEIMRHSNVTIAVNSYGHMLDGELKMDRIYIRRKANGKIVFQKPVTKKNAERVKFLLNKQCPAGCFVDSYEVDKPNKFQSGQ